MSRFDECLAIVLSFEGGKSDHKTDRGGRTNFGVTQKTYDNYRLAKGLEKQDVFLITEPEVNEIYGEYWNNSKCQLLPKPLDLCVFDCAVNSGASKAVKILQQVAGVRPDGIFGVQTAAAIANAIARSSVSSVCDTYLQIRRVFYRSIVDVDPSQSVFLKGWYNRLEKLERVGHADK